MKKINLSIKDMMCDLLIINDLFPDLEKQKYILALNNKIVANNTIILHNSNVACMPPFAGG